MKDKKILTYDDLLKYSQSSENETLDSDSGKKIIGDAFLFLSTFFTLLYLCWRIAFSIPFAYGWEAVAGSCILLGVEILDFAEELNVGYFDRPNNEGAKAGNLNAALARSHSPYVVTFDADMIPQRAC